MGNSKRLVFASFLTCAFLLLFFLTVACGDPLQEQPIESEVTEEAEERNSDSDAFSQDSESTGISANQQRLNLSEQLVLSLQAITDDEASLLQSHMYMFDLGECLSSEILLDRLGDFRYLIGVSDTGYLILDRYSLRMAESVEGESPYAGYEDCVKYYGGIFCYVIETEDSLLLLPDETISDTIPYNPALEKHLDEATLERMKSLQDSGRLAGADSLSVLTAPQVKRLSAATIILDVFRLEICPWAYFL